MHHPTIFFRSPPGHTDPASFIPAHAGLVLEVNPSYQATIRPLEILKSSRSFASSGIRGYRITRYPAAVSSSSRAASCCARFLWLLSSSSITARTFIPRSHKTKSATFWLKVPRVGRCFVSSNAENETCARTTCRGNVSLSRKNIFSSCSVRGLLDRRSRGSVPALGFPFPFIAAATPSTTIKSTITQIKSFINFPLLASNRNGALS